MFKKIYIEITNICNLKCKFCPETSRKKECMSVENFENIIDEIHGLTNLVCLHIKGEPLLHPQFDKILQVLDKYNLQTNITTNGTLLKEKIDILNKYKIVRQINISLHSFTQNLQMNEGYFDEVFDSVDKLNENIIVSYRLWNMNSVGENEENVSILNALTKKYGIDEMETALKKQTYLQLAKNIFINEDTEFTWPDINGEIINESGRCLALKDQIGILVDGTVVPCCLDNNGDIKLGNIFDEHINEILEKSFSKDIVNNFQKNVITCDLCRTCGFLKRLEEKRK